jgi:Glyoxalase/Bleomycin resistance protein/Dioxygenase superfamily
MPLVISAPAVGTGLRTDSGEERVFRVDDFGMALARARALVARLEEEPHVNPNTGTEEFTLRDPDGYYVTINAISAA